MEKEEEEAFDPDVDKIEPSTLPKPYLEVFRYPQDALDGYFAERKRQEMYPDIEDEDSVYESMGATITETRTTYADGRTITRKEKKQ